MCIDEKKVTTVVSSADMARCRTRSVCPSNSAVLTMLGYFQMTTSFLACPCALTSSLYSEDQSKEQTLRWKKSVPYNKPNTLSLIIFYSQSSVVFKEMDIYSVVIKNAMVVAFVQFKLFLHRL